MAHNHLEVLETEIGRGGSHRQDRQMLCSTVFFHLGIRRVHLQSRDKDHRVRQTLDRDHKDVNCIEALSLKFSQS